MPKFLVDESCDFAIVAALREAGQDVVAIAEISPRADDRAVVERAVGEQRVLVTEDKDFGQLVFAEGARSAGVVLLRYRATARGPVIASLLSLVRHRGDALRGCFAVVRPGSTRISRLPHS